MKKRVVSMLMAGAMVLSSFAGMTMSAHAANVSDTSFTFIGIKGEDYSRSNIVSIPKGTRGSITNYVRENAGTQARLKFREQRASSFSTWGVWSPDSTQNYTVYN